MEVVHTTQKQTPSTPRTRILQQRGCTFSLAKTTLCVTSGKSFSLLRRTATLHQIMPSFLCYFLKWYWKKTKILFTNWCIYIMYVDDLAGTWPGKANSAFGVVGMLYCSTFKYTRTKFCARTLIVSYDASFTHFRWPAVDLFEEVFEINLRSRYCIHHATHIVIWSLGNWGGRQSEEGLLPVWKPLWKLQHP